MKKVKISIIVVIGIMFYFCSSGSVFASEEVSNNNPPGMNLQQLITPVGNSVVIEEVDQAGNVIRKKIQPNSSLNAGGSALSAAAAAPAVFSPTALARAPFPIPISAETAGDVTVADLDLDGRNEVIVVTSNSPTFTTVMAVRVYDQRGNLKPGWTTPKLVNTNSSTGHQITVGDIDNDAAKDLEFCVNATCFHHNGTIAWTPKNPPGCARQSYEIRIASIVDLDNDGKNEVVGTLSDVARVPNHLCFVGSTIYIWDGPTAKLLQNISLPIEWKGTLGYDYVNIILGISVGDITGDKNLEIIASGFSGSLTSNIYNLHAYHHTGVNVWSNLPKQRKNILTTGANNSFGYDIGNPTLADVFGNDGKDEIAVIINAGTGLTGISINRGNPTGDFVPGWPQLMPVLPSASSLMPYIGLGDLDGDGNLEILATLVSFTGPNRDDVAVFAYKSSGSLLNGWPAYFPNLSVSEKWWWGTGYGVQTPQALVAPLRRSLPICTGNICTAPVLDKTKDVLIPIRDYTQRATNVYTINSQGQVLPSKTLVFAGDDMTTGATLVDLDKDGSLDVGISTMRFDFTNRTTSSNISFTNLNTMTPANHEMHWPMLGKDNKRTFKF